MFSKILDKWSKCMTVHKLKPDKHIKTFIALSMIKINLAQYSQKFEYNLIVLRKHFTLLVQINKIKLEKAPSRFTCQPALKPGLRPRHSFPLQITIAHSN